jgi:hypothetical protein
MSLYFIKKLKIQNLLHLLFQKDFKYLLIKNYD